jgi:hypothetical protein
MVDDIVLRQLNAALQDAANKRNEIQARLNDLRTLRDDANRNLQRAHTQEQQAAEAERAASETHRKTLAYYNGLADKTGLEAILARVELLEDQQREAGRILREAREIRMRRNTDFEQAQRNFAAAEPALKQAQEEWQRISAQVNQAYNER